MIQPMTKVWEIIDLVVQENIKEDEEIKTMGPTGTVRFTYARIRDHILFQTAFETRDSVFQVVTTPTLRIMVREIIEYMRGQE
jgi:hypothetical protein